MEQKPTTIFINPKFKNAHFNPHFIPNNKIHESKIFVNPKFLQQSNSREIPLQQLPVQPPTPPQPELRSNAIIRNTRRTLIRATAPRSTIGKTDPQTEIKHIAHHNQLIKLSKNKLVTAAHLMKCQQKENEMIKNTTASIIKSKKLHRKTETKDSVYKLDHRFSPLKKKKRIVSTYSIRRVDTSKSPASAEKRININGLLYNSTNRKLERTPSTGKLEKMLVIRGENFLLDPSGSKLRRDSESHNLNLSRIHIGGITYKKGSQDGAYERDNSHQIRNHLSSARTKSISLLARTYKTSHICPIYRRLGKCLAYANGRCHKIHDQRYVIVCPKIIKGSCSNEKCLLSHNVNLHKMPVCKYFLQGLCQKQRECFYLHKKLSDDTKLCSEFLKGYCPLADKCNLLHDFPKSDKKKISVIRNKPRKKISEEDSKAPETSRYYIDEKTSNNDNKNVPKRGILGALPSYIPF